EIYIKETLDYKNGNLVGFAENDILSQAKTVQAFLISSIFGSMKEVVSLQPVRNISGDQLHEMALSILKVLLGYGFIVVAVVTDNVRVNQNMLMKLTEGSADQHYFHLSPDYPTFVMFDTVHLLKIIRNNWLNLKNITKTFIFPDFDNKLVRKANFVDIRNFYKLE
ncbi:unnamed protein product, partial [Callosobruchus maculatus]